jgi:hypothetical protein
MKKTILVAGATGNLGYRIVKALILKGANVKAIVRNNSDSKKLQELRDLGVEVVVVDVTSDSDLKEACVGVSCVISALAGLSEVIIDTQLKILNAAVAAGVPRFIPSDFCTDFTSIPVGENRNFDLRKEFQAHLDKSQIQATSIFNGCFSDILRYNTPLFNNISKSIAFFDDKKDWKMDFTAMDDTATFTALAALDDSTPRFLRIASFQVSPNDLVQLSEQYKNQKFELIDNGSMESFSAYNKSQRAANPQGEKELYATWQLSQYVYSMFLVNNINLDNDRYPNLKWSSVEENI